MKTIMRQQEDLYLRSRIIDATDIFRLRNEIPNISNEQDEFIFKQHDFIWALKNYVKNMVIVTDIENYKFKCKIAELREKIHNILKDKVKIGIKYTTDDFLSLKYLLNDYVYFVYTSGFEDEARYNIFLRDDSGNMLIYTNPDEYIDIYVGSIYVDDYIKYEITHKHMYYIFNYTELDDLVLERKKDR